MTTPAGDPAAAVTRGGAAGPWDRIIEAGWLAALATVPVFFNAYSFRTFEPDKAAVLRAIALVILAAWLARSLGHFGRGRGGAETGGRREGQAGPPARVLGLALALFGWTAATAAFSIAPGLSLEGSYHREQGLDTLAAYFVVFLSIAAAARSPSQVERAVTAVLIASCPVAVYALVQSAELDPVRWARAAQRPVVSTMGNALFLAGFLVMLIPLSAGRLWTAAAALATRLAPRRRSAAAGGAAASAVVALVCWLASPPAGALAGLALLAGWGIAGWRAGRATVAGVAVAAYATLLALQIGAVLLSASRGPFLGLLGGAFFFALAVAARHRSRRALACLAALALAVVAVFALVRMPDSPLGVVQNSPTGGRLVNVLDTSGTGRVRLLLWQQALDAWRADPARALLGHGPETIRLALAPYYPPALGEVEDRAALPDRAHNETLDRMLTTGLVGTALYYALLTGLLWLGLRLGGVIPSGARAATLAVTVVAAALFFSALARWLDGSWRLLGLTLPLGLLAGLGLYAAWPTLRRGRLEAHAPGPATSGEALAMALTAGLISHVVEIHFGIATVSTTLCFWALAGLLLACALRSRRPPAGRPAAAPAVNELPPALATFALAVLGLSFGFATAGVGPADHPPYAWLLRVSFVLCGLMILVAAWRPGSGLPAHVRAFEIAAYHVSVFLAALLLPRLAIRWADRVLPGPAPAVSAYFVLLMAGLLLLAAALGRGLAARGGWRHAAAWLGLTVAVTPAVWWSSIRPLQADAAFKQALFVQAPSGDGEGTLASLEEARRLAPRQAHYQIQLARLLADLRSAEDGPAERDARYARAETLLMAARDRRPGDVDPVLELGRVQARWADLTEDPAARAARLERALASLRAAVSLSPGRPIAWNAYGSTLAIADRHEEALEAFERSRDLDPRFPETYLLGARIQDELGRPDEALAILERGTGQAEPSAALHRALAGRYALRGRAPEAEREYLAALEIDPRHRAGHVGLVGLRLQAGDCEGAGQALDEMARRRPGDPALDRLRAALDAACARTDAD